jgi:flavin reductase
MMIDQQQFVRTMRRAANSVTVVTTDGEGGRHGATVSAMTSVSDKPPSLLICLNQKSSIGRTVQENGVFCVNLLGQHHKRVANVFAGRDEGLNGMRFNCATWNIASRRLPVLSDAVAAFCCRVAKSVPFGTHTIIIGEVFDSICAGGPPLAYFDGDYCEFRGTSTG